MGTTPLDRLRAAASGTVTGPDDGGYDDARAPWNLTEQHPVAVLDASSPDDVEAAVAVAADAGLRVVTQATGHSSTGGFDDAVLIRTRELASVDVDPARKVATIGPGTHWGAVQEAAAGHGLTGLVGTAPHVSAVGFTMGGGVSWLGRTHGLASGRLRAAELVLADGSRTRVDETSDPDLLWALRGGGGNFGIVVGMELDLVDAPEVFAGVVMFPIERTRELLGAWHEWTASVPEAVTSMLTVLRLPPAPFIPKEFRGKELVVIGACHADGTDGAADLAPIRGLDPFMDTFGPMPPTGLGALHNDPVDPLPDLGGAAMLKGLDDEALDILAAHTGPESGSPLLFTELRHAGGAMGRAAAGEGANDHLDGDYLLHGLGVPLGPPAEVLRGAIDRLRADLSRWTTPGLPLNFVHERDEVASAFAPETLERLIAVKSRVDPDRRITSSHPLGPAGG